MKIKYLGTAASEGWPAVFCNCEYCKKAKALGGRNIRTRSQALINDDLLIDFPSDTYQHMLDNKLDLSGVRYCFVTHSHYDHFQPMDLYCRDKPYGHDFTEPLLSLFGNAAVCKVYSGTIHGQELQSVEMNEIKPFDVTVAGDYKVTALPANHAPYEEALIYIIEEGDKTLLYLHDTGMMFDSVYEYLKDNRIHADLISYDCTFVALKSNGGHLGLDSVPIVRDKLKEIGVVKDSTIHVVNHFSHNGMLLHEELCREAEKIGFMVAYDGMEIEI